MDTNDGRMRALKMVHIVLLTALWLIPLFVYGGLPDEIPSHFNFDGTPDGWSQKASIWLLPIIGTVLGAGVLVLLRYPQSFNHPRKDEVQKLPEHLRPNVYVILQEMLLAIFILVDVMFVTIMYGMIRSVEHGGSSSIIVTVVVLGFAPLLSLICYLPRISRTIDRLRDEAAMTGQATKP